MVNVSNSFINYIKKSLKSQGLNPQDCVTCFICKQNENKEYELQHIIYPLYLFDNDTEKAKLKMGHPSLYKKGGCWFASDNNSFFFLVSKKLTIDKNGKFKILKTPSKGRNSLIYFIGSCLKEHAINKKLSNKELAGNLKISTNKLNEIFKGTFIKLDISHLVSISMEFEGYGNMTKRFVMFEKITYKKESFRNNFDEFDFDE